MKNIRNLNKFKSNNDLTTIKTGHVFFDSRGEVSLQRLNYTTEEKCLEMGAKNPNSLIGFVLFQREVYDNVVEEHTKSAGRGEFESELKYSPLDEEDKLITKRPVYSHEAGSPAHCGINYINPGEIAPEEPNTAIRIFAYKLLKVCTLKSVD